eukprot:COSAG01_NODE_71217_length_256_cov_1.292994_1_plen_32_part_10
MRSQLALAVQHGGRDHDGEGTHLNYDSLGSAC